MLGLAKNINTQKVPEEILAKVYLARQPIFDDKKDIFAYELLYRSSNVNSAQFEDASKATSELITNTFLSLGFDTISNGKKVFINLPRKFVTGELPMPLDPAIVVLEVLEDVVADKQAVAGVEALTKQGFSMALDDFVEHEDSQAFIPYASYIKVDVLNISETDLCKQAERLYSFGVPLLAEKVETYARYELCKELGFRYFQGYFFSKPVLMAGKVLSPNQVSMLNVLAKLQNPECQVEDLEHIIGNDLGLSFKLLKIINSSFYNIGKTVESVHHALILLGLNALKKWVTLITLSSVKGKTSELLVLALLRARHCECLAEKLKLKPEAAFTVGMFSLLDAIMDQPLPLLLAQLPLSIEVKAALLEGRGELGELLKAVTDYEVGNWELIHNRFVHKDAIQLTYEQALEWSKKVKDDLAA